MAGAKVKGITIDIGANTDQFTKELAKVNKATRETSNKLKDINKLLKLDPKNVNLLEQKQRTLNDAISQTKQRLGLAKDALKQLKEQNPDKVTDEMDALQRQIAEDEAKLKSLNKEFKEFGSVGKQQAIAVGKEMQEAGKKVTEVGSKIKGVGDTLTTHVTAPIVALGGASIAAFNEVDGAYDTVIQKTGATGEAAQGLYDIIDSLATSIPTDFDTAANAVGEVNTRFGLTGDELEELSGQFIKFAELNGTDVSHSVDVVQSAMAAFGLEAEDAADVLDILNKAGQDTGVPLDQLASSLTANGTALQEMGFGINESVGFLANLDKSGVDASSVMTGLKKALQNATKDGKSMSDALEELQKEMENAGSDTEAAQKAMELFGNKAGPAIANAVQEGRLSFDDLTNTVTDWGGSVSDTFEETVDPIDQWQMTLNELKLTGADLGATLGEILLPILKDVGDIVQTLREKWESLTPEQQKMIETIAIIAAVVGPVISMLGTLIMTIGGLITSVGVITATLGISTAAFGGIIAVIAAVIAIIVLCITHWDEIKAAVKQFTEDAIAYVTKLKDELATKFEEIKNKISEKLTEIKSKFTEKFDEIKAKVKGVIDDIKGFFENLKLKIPKIELPSLPKFKIVGEFSLNPPSAPHIEVEWNAKAMNNPYLFTTPTLFGAGEAGAEVMYGKNNLMKDIATATAANNEQLIDGFYNAMIEALKDTNLTVQIGRREFGRIVREVG